MKAHLMMTSKLFFKTMEGFEIIDSALKLTAKFNSEHTLITVTPPNEIKRIPTDICCVVDISGSMGDSADIKTNTGQESQGLSILDIVKHALKTITASLSPEDEFSLVIFDDTATMILDHEINKDKIMSSIEELAPRGSTNLWDGLRVGLNTIKNGKLPNKSLFILTDGLPNVSPPRGELEAFKQYMDSSQLTCTVNTFGFGYNLDSQLLANLATSGNGTFAFIPDGSLVGTVFINAVANALSTVAQQAILKISTQSKTVGNYTNVSWGYQIPLGNILAGQSRNIIVKGKIESVELTALNKSGIQVTLKEKPTDYKGTFDQLDREIMIIAIQDAYKHAKLAQLTKSQEIIKTCISTIQGHASTEYNRALLQDMMGQVSEAFSRQNWFDKWGKHYLLSLTLAHQLQLCNNFKDPGVQCYGNTLFKQLQKEIESLFLSLPPPKASLSHGSNAPVSMNSYYSSSNPCFDGEGLVKLEKGFKKVKMMKKGDILHNGAKLICIVKTTIETEIDMVDLKVKLTPYHPIKLDDKFVFPMTVKEPEKFYCDYIYSFVLDTHHTVSINGIECITLGHGVTDDLVASHDYFGNRIIKDLETCNGYECGLVEMPCTWLKREDGVVVGMNCFK